MVNRKAENPFKWLLSALFSVIALGGCGENGEHQPVGGQSAPVVSGVAVQNAPVAPMAYSEIQPILRERCLRCHSNGALNWNDPDNLQRVAKNGILVRYITTRHMPMAGSPEAQAIKDPEREKLVAWARSQLSQSTPTPAVAPASTDSQSSTHSNLKSEEMDLRDKQAAKLGSGPTLDIANALLSPPITVDRFAAVAFRCMSCHGGQGMSVADAFPNLAGHGPTYIANRLTEFLDPQRLGVMPQMLQTILRESGFPVTYEMVQGRVEPSKELVVLFQALGKTFGYYSVSTPPAEFVKKREQLSKLEMATYETGKKIVLSRCLSCHLGPDLRPIDFIPMIFGQKRDYLKARFDEFRMQRERYPSIVMGNIAKEFTGDEIKAVVLYLSTTHPSEAR